LLGGVFGLWGGGGGGGGHWIWGPFFFSSMCWAFNWSGWVLLFFWGGWFMSSGS